MKKRPEIRRGDMVKCKKPYDNDTMYRVTRVSIDRTERRKLKAGYIRSPGAEGFADIRVCDIHGESYTFKRRDLWRVPNQPRDRKPTLMSGRRLRPPLTPDIQVISPGSFLSGPDV